MSEEIPANIRAFNLLVLTLFARLYAKFPLGDDFADSELAVASLPENAPYDETFDRQAVAWGTVTWLEAEGFIRIGSKTLGGDFDDVKLTMKGLTALGSIPQPLRENEAADPIISRIKRTLASGAEKAGAEIVKSIVTALFKIALSYGSGASSSGGNIGA